MQESDSSKESFFFVRVCVCVKGKWVLGIIYDFRKYYGKTIEDRFPIPIVKDDQSFKRLQYLSALCHTQDFYQTKLQRKAFDGWFSTQSAVYKTKKIFMNRYVILIFNAIKT